MHRGVGNAYMESRVKKDEVKRAGAGGAVTVATFGHLLDAQLCKATLVAGGLRAFLPDEHTLSLNPHYIGAAQGIRVQVAEADRDRALSLLRAASEARAAAEQEEREEENRSDWDGDADHEEGPRCPACGRRYCYFEWTPIQKVFILILLGIPLMVLKKKWHCRACGKGFGIEKAEDRAESPYRKARGGARK